ncbi:MAG: cytochrome c, partial [Deltaproteobacteria bacterium]|nr:cytochrome c [Deltaproteobacteria bacterium]
FTTVFIDSEAFRHKMTRYTSLWCLISTAVAIPTGYWYLKVLPPMAQEIVSVSPTIANSIKVGAFATAAFIILVTICTLWQPKLHNMITAFVVAACAISMMGSFEWIREAGRRPYVISQQRYSNGIPVARVAELNNGFLAQSKWSTVTEVDESNLDQAGAELFKFQCYACHTLDGVNNDIRIRTANSTFNGMVKYLGVMHEKRAFMPPFIGSNIEKRALAAYLVGTLHGKVDWADGMSITDVTQGLLTLSQIDNSMEDFSGSAEQLNALVALLTGTVAPDDEAAIDGGTMLSDDCTMCHDLELVYDWAAELSEAQVMDGLLNLSSLNSSMDDFSGTEAELKAVSTFIMTEVKGGTQ